MTENHDTQSNGKTAPVILVVDDNHDNLRLLTGILSENGYSVRSVPNGTMALKSATRVPPDLILLDIMMPGMDGYTVCKHLKEDASTRAIPIIFISALHEVFDKVKGFSLGGVDYITKPFQVEEVLVRVANHLALRTMQQQLQAQNKALQQHIQERARAEHALRESERRFRLLAENARDMIYRYRLADPPGFDYVSPSVFDIMGYTPEEYYADPAFHKTTVHPDNLELFESFLQSPAAFQQPLTFGAVRKDGQAIWLEQHQWPIYDEAGAVVAIEGITRDVTERKRIESQLLQQQQALAMLRERERLARELHDSMGQVLGYMGTQAQTVRDHLHGGRVDLADTYLSRLISVAQDTHVDIREFILGVRVGEKTRHDFLSSLEQYFQRFQQIYSIQVSLQVEETDEHMLTLLAPAVEAHLLRIIQEALSNVRKHASATAVHVTMATHADRLRITIEDNGQGFHATLDHDEPLDQESGHNYGLRSMQDRAKEVGGTLTLDSSPGAGTRVVVVVPLHAPDAANVRALRVMLVDDHPLFLEGMRNMLIARGIAIVGTASDGREAVQKARTLRPDIILMDVEMPVCNGLEATRRIKAELPDVQIVMLTVSTDDEHLFDAIKNGASGYLLKNLDAGDFFTMLAGLEQGEAALSPDMARKVLYEFAQQEQPPAHNYHPHPVPEVDEQELSRLQVEILTLVSQGRTYREVGETIGYSERSIKYHMGEIVKRLHLKNRAEAVAYARKIGLS